MKVYTSHPPTAPQGELRVGIADFAVGSGDVVLTSNGFGSCVGVALYDPASGVVGLLHFMLPSQRDGVPGTDAKFADTGIPRLVEAMRERGADGRLQAKLAGGSEMLALTNEVGSIGARNVEAARTVLGELGIRTVAEDVGGTYGRSLRLYGGTGELVVKSALHGTHKL